MRTALIIGNSVAFGWFVCRALYEAEERIYDWREPARWAVLSAFLVACLLVLL